MRPSAAPESDHGDGAPARDRGAAQPSGALTQVPSTAPNPQIPPRAPRYARAPLTLRPTPAAALVQPGAPAAEGVEARGGRGGGDRHVLHAIGSVASVGPKGRHAGSASAGRLCRRRRCAEPADRPVQARAGGPCRCRRARAGLAGAGSPASGADATSLSWASAVSSSRRTRSIGVRPPPLASPAIKIFLKHFRNTCQGITKVLRQGIKTR